MTISLVQAFKVAVVVGAGYELGRILPGTVIRMLNKQFRDDVKGEYRRRMHVVRNETPTTGA